MIPTLLQVALGGAIGASARYLTGLAAIRLIGPGFPWGTLTVNVVGSFIMGAIVVGLAHLGQNRFAPFLMTGLLGGFTTFSTFGFETFALLADGEWGWALANVTLANALGLIAVWSGYRLAVLWQGV